MSVTLTKEKQDKTKCVSEKLPYFSAEGSRMRDTSEEIKQKLIGQRGESIHTPSNRQTCTGTASIKETGDTDFSTAIQDPAVSLVGSSSYASSSQTFIYNKDQYIADDDNSLCSVGRRKIRASLLASYLGKQNDVKHHKRNKKESERALSSQLGKNSDIQQHKQEGETPEDLLSVTRHATDFQFGLPQNIRGIEDFSMFLTPPPDERFLGYSNLSPSVTYHPDSPDSGLPVSEHSTNCTEEILNQDASDLFSSRSESTLSGDFELGGDVEPQNIPEHLSVIDTLPAQLSSRDSCELPQNTSDTEDSISTFPSPPFYECFPRRSDFITPSVAGCPCPDSSLPVSQHSNNYTGEILKQDAKNKNSQANSLPDIPFKEFTPVITPDFDDETYRFQFSCPGLYQCSVTGLVFHMEGEGDVVYRTVPWNRRLLGQHHKKPAGPLFDIRCLQQSVRQLHLPHCEIRSTGGCQFLSVAHVNDEGIEFISPHKITETHVVINISGFSEFGIVKDEDSPPDPVQALVLLFYRPPDDPDPESLINVLLLPGNVVLNDVLRTRKKLFGDEMYKSSCPQCKLQPKQLYTLSTRPHEDSVLVQPEEAEFDEESYGNYFESFQVILKTIIRNIDLSLKDKKSSLTVWERHICLSSTRKRKSCGHLALNLPPDEKLSNIRSSFVSRISGPVLNTLVDHLLEKKVISDAERESVKGEKNKEDKACFVIDTVRNKGEAASSEMIHLLCEVDPFLCEHLGLK